MKPKLYYRSNRRTRRMVATLLVAVIVALVIYGPLSGVVRMVLSSVALLAGLLPYLTRPTYIVDGVLICWFEAVPLAAAEAERKGQDLVLRWEERGIRRKYRVGTDPALNSLVEAALTQAKSTGQGLMTRREAFQTIWVGEEVPKFAKFGWAMAATFLWVVGAVGSSVYPPFALAECLTPLAIWQFMPNRHYALTPQGIWVLAGEREPLLIPQDKIVHVDKGSPSSRGVGFRVKTLQLGYEKFAFVVFR